MSPYGGASRQYLTDTKGQRCHLGFGGELSGGKAAGTVSAHAALGELGGDYNDVEGMVGGWVGGCSKWISPYMSKKKKSHP